MNLSTVLTLRAGPAGYLVSVPDGWQQGPGVYGGLPFGWLARAAMATRPQRPLRGLSVQLCGPVLPGEASLRVESLREGGTVSHLALRLEQQDQVRAAAIATLGDDRDLADWAPPMPEAPDWRGIEPLPTGPPMPVFAKHFAYRPCLGATPWSGADLARSGGWIQPRAAPEVRDAAVVAALLDTWWPAALVCHTKPRPMATVTALLHFLAEGGDPGSPCLHTVRSDAATAGYTVEDRALWDGSGRLLGLCRQTMIVVR